MSGSAESFETRRPAMSDSPWFWVLLFSLAGLVALVVISPQYAKRQRRLEMQYQAREEMTRRQLTGEPRARDPGDEGEAPPPAPGDLIIPLWPLELALVVVGGLAGRMLWQSRVSSRVESDAVDRGAPP
jgi:hypothetical protein